MHGLQVVVIREKRFSLITSIEKEVSRSVCPPDCPQKMRTISVKFRGGWDRIPLCPPQNHPRHYWL